MPRQYVDDTRIPPTIGDPYVSNLATLLVCCIREFHSNSNNYDAKKAYAFMAYHNKKDYLIYAHNGGPFLSLDKICTLGLTPSKTESMRGAYNGLGLIHSAMTLHGEEPCLMIASRTPQDGFVAASSHINVEDRTSVITPNDEEVLELIKERWGENEPLEYTVFYIVRVEIRDKDRSSNGTYFSQPNMNDLPFLHEDLFRDIEFRYAERQVGLPSYGKIQKSAINDVERYKSIESMHKYEKLDGGRGVGSSGSTRAPVMAMEDFKKAYSTHEFSMKTAPVEFKLESADEDVARMAFKIGFFICPNISEKENSPTSWLTVLNQVESDPVDDMIPSKGHWLAASDGKVTLFSIHDGERFVPCGLSSPESNPRKAMENLGAKDGGDGYQADMELVKRKRSKRGYFFSFNGGKPQFVHVKKWKFSGSQPGKKPRNGAFLTFSSAASEVSSVSHSRFKNGACFFQASPAEFMSKLGLSYSLSEGKRRDRSPFVIMQIDVFWMDEHVTMCSSSLDKNVEIRKISPFRILEKYFRRRADFLMGNQSLCFNLMKEACAAAVNQGLVTREMKEVCAKYWPIDSTGVFTIPLGSEIDYPKPAKVVVHDLLAEGSPRLARDLHLGGTYLCASFCRPANKWLRYGDFTPCTKGFEIMDGKPIVFAAQGTQRNIIEKNIRALSELYGHEPVPFLLAIDKSIQKLVLEVEDAETLQKFVLDSDEKEIMP